MKDHSPAGPLSYTYAIGDIQGCFDTFMCLLDVVSYQPGKDRLWLVGDLVNRGPKNLEVLRWARNQGRSIQAVLGNHDLHCLARAMGISEPKKKDTLEDVLQAPDRHELVDWLLTLPFLHTEGDRSLVHAGVLPQWTTARAQDWARAAQEALRREPRAFLERLTRGKGNPNDPLEHAVSALTRLRTCSPDGLMEADFSGPPNEAPPGYEPWFSIPTRQSRGHTFVFGHWAALGLSQGADWLGIDTGCVWGNRLTAVRLEDGAVFQQPSVER